MALTKRARNVSPPAVWSASSVRSPLPEDRRRRHTDRMVADPKTRILYLFLFEAPEAQWSDAWVDGEKIMNALAVGNEV